MKYKKKLVVEETISLYVFSVTKGFIFLLSFILISNLILNRAQSMSFLNISHIQKLICLKYK